MFTVIPAPAGVVPSSSITCPLTAMSGSTAITLAALTSINASTTNNFIMFPPLFTPYTTKTKNRKSNGYGIFKGCYLTFILDCHFVVYIIYIYIALFASSFMNKKSVKKEIILLISSFLISIIVAEIFL